jgi:2-isopropylmalate synthase
VPAGLFGREQEIEIGHMSGESNVVYWLTKRHIDPAPPLVAKLLAVAKSCDHILTDDEIHQVPANIRARCAPLRAACIRPAPWQTDLHPRE